MVPWWKETIFYQIYISGFCDGNGDGVGDLRGIIEKLPYLERLGVGGIWLTPFYPSPKVDNGYDVSDYKAVAPEYGTMEDFTELLEKAHARNIRVIADIVVNHTSSAHPWFREALKHADSDKRNFYIFRKPKQGADAKERIPPNNWESFFGGSAWELDGGSGEYYYHSFAKEQVDLNWGNQAVEEAIFDILDFWAEKGIDGFRFDVINNLTLLEEMPDNPYDSEGKQIHRYDVDQSGIYEKLEEISRHIKERSDLFLVGEISSEELPLLHSYVQKAGLDATFNFNLGSREKFVFEDFFDEISQMNERYKEELPTLFFGSHDMGRFRSRFGFDVGRVQCLLTFLLTGRGIPFLYYGDEIGMEDEILRDPGEAKDIQGILAYERALSEGKDRREALEILNRESRDKSRGAMRWDENEILSFTRKLTKIRKEEKAFSLGTCEYQSPAPGVLCINREYEGKTFYVWINFSGLPFYGHPESMTPLLTSFHEVKSERDGYKLPPGCSVIFYFEETKDKTGDAM